MATKTDEQVKQEVEADFNPSETARERAERLKRETAEALKEARAEEVREREAADAALLDEAAGKVYDVIDWLEANSGGRVVRAFSFVKGREREGKATPLIARLVKPRQSDEPES